MNAGSAMFLDFTRAAFFQELACCGVPWLTAGTVKQTTPCLGHQAVFQTLKQ